MTSRRTRVLFVAQRSRLEAGRLPATGAGAHVAATLAGLEASFDVLPLFAEEAAPGPASAALRAVRSLVPGPLRGLRQDWLTWSENRRFFERTLERARAFAPDVVHARSEYACDAGPRLARRLGVPLVLEVNGLHAADVRLAYRSLAEPLGALLERRKHAAAAAIVVESPGMAERIARLGGRPERMHVVPNAVAPGRVASVPRPVRSDSAVVGFIGHLMPWHVEALEELLRAAPLVLAAAPGARFRIVGGGAALPDLAARAQALGLGDRFEMAGPVPHDAVPSVLAGFDVGVIPTHSHHEYTFPVKIVDMAAAGLPFVSPRSPSLDALLAPGVEYEPFAPGDARDLAAALLRLLGDPERRRRMGAAAHAAAAARFTWTRVAERLAVVVERVVGEHRAVRGASA